MSNIVLKNYFRNISISFESLVWIYIFVLGAIFIFLIPPFQHADETQHFFRTGSILSGQILCKQDSAGPYIMLPKAYYELPTLIGYGIIVSSNKMLFPLHNFRFGLSRMAYWTDLTRVNVCLPSVGYLPNLVGMWFFKTWPLLALYAGRISAFIFFLVCFYWSLRIIPKRFKNILLAYVLLPMVIHQASGISYDVVQVSLIMPIISLFFSFIEDKHISLKKLFLFWILVTWIAISKQSYFLFGLLYFFIVRKKIGTKWSKYLLITTLYLVGYGVVLFITNKVFGFPSKVFPWLLNAPLQLLMIKKDPLYLIYAFINAFRYNLDFYVKSIIGIFGETDSEMNIFSYFLIVLSGGYLIFKTISTLDIPRVSCRWLCLMTTFLIVSILIIFGSLFVAADTIGSGNIVGVQGRYFLVYLPLIIFCLIEMIKYLRQWQITWILWLVVLTLIVGNVGNTVYLRYFDLSNNISNRDELKNEITLMVNKKVIFEEMKIDKPYEFKYDLSDLKRKKIVGFQIDTATNSAYLNLPYKYFIKDENCNKILRQGYLNLGLLQPGGIYEDLFNAISTKSKNLCVSFEPLIYYDDEWNYLRVLTNKNIPLFKFLLADYY